MIQKLSLAALLALMLLFFAGCEEPACQHDWKGATCTAAPVCTLCGRTSEHSGPLGHSWQDAACGSPKTCAVCGEIQSTVTGHSWNLQSPTCTEAMTCTVCGLVQEQALGHPEKVPATCTAAETCKLCGETFGKPLGHSWQDATCESPKTCAVCGETQGKAPGHTYVRNVCTVCAQPMIGDYAELYDHLHAGFSTLTTAIGSVEHLTFTVTEKDPHWDSFDFRIEIESDLYCEALGQTLDHCIFYDNSLTYEVRMQAAADILNYQARIVQVCEEAFPDRKFELLFYTSEYEYPETREGFRSSTKLIWRNWEYLGNGLPGTFGTDQTRCTVYPADFMNFHESNMAKWKNYWKDICSRCPRYRIEWQTP